MTDKSTLKIIPLATLVCLLPASFLMRKKIPTQCPPLKARSAAHPSAASPSRRPPKPSRHLSPLSLPAVAPFILFVSPPCGRRNTWEALLRGGAAPGLLAPLVLRAPLSLRCRSLRSQALRAGGWCCSCAALSRCCSWLPPLRCGRTPPLPFGLAVVAAARLAARRSCAVGRLRSLPACRFSPRPGLRRLRLRRCAPCPHRRLGLVAASVPLSSGGAAAWLVCRSSFGGCSRVARLVLLCVVLFLRFRLRRAFPAVAPSPPTLRFPASPWLSRAALLHSSAPLRRALSSLRSAPVIRSQRAAPSAVALCRLPLWYAAARSARHCARSSAPPTRAAADPRAGK